MCAHCALPLCAFIVRFIVRAMGVVRQHSVHNGAPPSLHNEAAQCEIIVRPAWHNGRAYIGEAKSAWHNDFVIVQFCFICVSFNTIQGKLTVDTFADTNQLNSVQFGIYNCKKRSDSLIN